MKFFKEKQKIELVYTGKTKEVDVVTDDLDVLLRKVKVFGDIKNKKWFNMLIFGDNLQILKTLLKWKEKGKLKNPDGSSGVKLIYIDPPFGTGDIYKKRGIGVYSSKLTGVEYLEWLRQRIILLRELLSDSGSFYIRIDYHFGHYVKVLLDEIFGSKNFRNEIVVKRGYVPKGLKNCFSTETESIFFYVKNIKNMCFKGFVKEISQEERKWISLDMPGEIKTYEKQIRFFPSSKDPGKRVFLPPKGQHWGLSQEKIDELFEKGDIRINMNRTYIDLRGNLVKGMPEYRKEPYILVTTNWTDIQGYVTHNTFYPTENSEQLLERIIKASSDEGDIVLDAFAGSGTTGAVAEKLKRRWIMIDCSKVAIHTMIKRMFNLKQEIGNKGKSLEPKPFIVYNTKLNDVRVFKNVPFDIYREFVLKLFRCEDNPHVLGGIELDGYIGYDHVLVFKWEVDNKDKEKYMIDRDFIDNIHSILKNKINKKFFIIAPEISVLFLEDCVERDGIKYYVLKVPYSVIDKFREGNFKFFKELNISKVNKVMEQIGFDFINPPDVKCKYYIDKQKGEAVIRIIKFKSRVISGEFVLKNKFRFKDLSMVMIDYNFNGKYFNMCDKWFVFDLERNNYEIRFKLKEVGEKIMIIYIDIYGNEKREVKTLRDF